MNDALKIKAAIAAFFGAVTAVIGWFGWLFILFTAVMALDFVMGTVIAAKCGKWKSSLARNGIWHKCAELVVVLCAIALDLLVGLVVDNIPAIALSFDYSVLISPVVLVWYIITELGSIIENAGELGAPIPNFLRKAINSLHDSIDPE